MSCFNCNYKCRYSNLVNLTHDLTFWDEHVEFVEFKEKAKDLEWYEVNIKSIGESYNVDYVATYNIQKNLIKESNFEKIKSHLIIPNELFSKIYEEKQLQFYLKLLFYIQLNFKFYTNN